MNAAINTHATMMLFPSCLPNWNSLDSVRRAHNELEGAALVFFALLVVAEAIAHLTESKKREKAFDKLGIIFFAIAVLAEIAAYPYGQRNDTLSGKVIDSLDTKAGNAVVSAVRAGSAASAAQTASGEAVTRATEAKIKAAFIDKQLNAASERLRHLQEFLTPRSLNQKEQNDLAVELRPLADPAARIIVIGSRESGLGDAVVSILKNAGFANTEIVFEDVVPFGMAASASRKYQYLAGKIAGALLNKGIGPMLGAVQLVGDGEPIRFLIGDIRTAPLPPLM